MAEAFGVSGAQPVDGMVALTQLYAAIIVTGYAVQAVGSLRGEETAGRLEVRLSGTLSRMRWLAAHGLVIVTGLVVIVVVSSIPAAWAVLAGITFIALLGPGLKLPTWLLDLSPTTHVGNPPLGTVEALPLVVLGALAAVLGVTAAIGFRRRGVPQS